MKCQHFKDKFNKYGEVAGAAAPEPRGEGASDGRHGPGEAPRENRAKGDHQQRAQQSGNSRPLDRDMEL